MQVQQIPSKLYPCTAFLKPIPLGPERGVGTTKLGITGDNSLTITANLDVELVTVDGSAATGAISLTTGATDAVSITTGSGNDTVESGGGADTYVTGAGADSITSAGGNDTITSGDGADIILSGADNDSIVSGAGADVITAGTGNDNVNAGADGDTIKFALNDLTTDDTIDGGAGTDTIGPADEVIADVDFTNITNTEVLTSSLIKTSVIPSKIWPWLVLTRSFLPAQLLLILTGCHWGGLH